MNRKRFLFLILLAIGLAAVFAWRWQTSPGSAATPAASTDAAAEPSVRAGPPNQGEPRPVVRLDDAGPVRALAPPGPVNELVAKAGGGDAIAACQLAAELMDCRTQELLHGNNPQAAEHRPGPRCRALLGEHLDRHLEWLRQAAHAGEPEAMLRYAAGEGFGIPGTGFNFLRSPGFEQWRREAPYMLEALLEAGYPEAVIYRVFANDPIMGGPLAHLIAPDPMQDQTYNELLVLLMEPSPLTEMASTRLRARAGEQVVGQARLQAAQLHQQHFAGGRFDFKALDAKGNSAFPVMRSHGRTCSQPVEGAAP